MNLSHGWTEGMDFTNERDVLIEVLSSGHPHVQPMVNRLEELNQTHMLLHLRGEDDSPRHQLCINLLEEMDHYIRRAQAGAWN